MTPSERNRRTMDIDTSTQLSAERTRLAYEGTLLSWVRTAISLITFGFAIYKFSADLRGNNAVSEQGRWLGSSTVALIMIVAGLLTLFLSALQYRHDITVLRAQFGTKGRSSALWLAAGVSGLGFITMIAVILRQ